jgi:hypothetical protein
VHRSWTEQGNDRNNTVAPLRDPIIILQQTCPFSPAAYMDMIVVTKKYASLSLNLDIWAMGAS